MHVVGTVVALSAPGSCVVCDHVRRVRVVALLDPQVRGRGVAACPHCSQPPGASPVPIYLFPAYVDRPRSGDAA